MIIAKTHGKSIFYKKYKIILVKYKHICYNTSMKKVYLYFLMMFSFSVASISLTYAESDKNESSQTVKTEAQHPPHDHHETDHIKKLDEGLVRRSRHKRKSRI